MFTSIKIINILKKNKVKNWHKFSWKRTSYLVPIYCPEYFNPSKFNWEKYSWAVPWFSPQHFNSKKYNWEDNSWAIIHYRPELLDVNKADLKNIIETFPKYKGMSLKEIKKKAILNKL